MYANKRTNKQSAPRQVAGPVLRQSLMAVLSCVDAGSFANHQRHGNTKWRPDILLMMAVLWAVEQDPSLRQRWEQATAILRQWQPSAFVGTSYSGFIGALARQSAALLAVLLPALRERIRQVAGAKYWSISGRPAFAVDGTKVAVPWSDDTDRQLGEQTLTDRAKRRRKSRRPRSANSQAHLAMRPQILATLLWHIGTGLPWGWQLGPLGDNERDQARALLAALPPRSLLVMDAGFTGYALWSEIVQAGHDVVVRVGANVKLLTGLGWKVRTRGQFVYLWPDAQRRQQAEPLVLRLIKVAGPRHPVYLVTTVLDARELSDSQAGELYRQRWGIEGWFRSLKQTFGRLKMHSSTAEHALCELEWSIVGLALIQLQGVEALVAAGRQPHELSDAAAIRVFRYTVLHGDFTRRSLGLLRQRLQHAVVDGYQRRAPKAGRHVHRQRQTTPTGAPQRIRATAQQIRTARQLQALQKAA